MTKKQFLRAVAFVLVFCALLVLLCDAFEQDGSHFTERFRTYRTFEDGTVDAVYIGTSGVDRYWNAAKAYEKYGMVVYPLSTDAMPVYLYPQMVKEALKYQDLDLIILDPRAFGQKHTLENVDVRSRRLLDCLPFFSLSRLEMAFKVMEINHTLDANQPRFDISYILPFVKFHTKWSEEGYSLTQSLKNEQHAYGGFFLGSVLSVRTVELEQPVYDTDYYEELDPISEQALYELLDMLREVDAQVLFLDTPQVMPQADWGCMNTTFRILEEEGFDYLSYNLPGVAEEQGLYLDYSTDFYNKGHVNFDGSEKTTAAIAAYLDANYDLPDHRNDPAVQAYWDGIYDRILQTVEVYKADWAALQAAGMTAEGADAQEAD